ncbi:hypothetical protein [Nicoliella lavandulae]|uniref:Uncharacterized protein n=1 Tax=Nicoliella lavandulae TaxID=3082954 RepID=A0ABU8SLS4_9LACO
MRKQRKINAERLKYIQSIQPADAVQSSYLNINEDDVNAYLGGAGEHPVNVMSVDRNHVITFPESAYPNKGYYLIDIKFTPMHRKDFQATTQNYSVQSNNNQLGVNSGPSFGTVSGQSRQVEVPTDALLTLTTKDLKDSFTIKATKERTSDVQRLQQYFLLNAIQLKQLGI